MESLRKSGLALGLPHLRQLSAIDLRENDLNLSNADNCAAVMQVLNALPALTSIGICGNWDAADRTRCASTSLAMPPSPLL